MLAQHFQNLLQRLGALGDAAPAFDRLRTAYAEPHRAYHNLVHVQDCLEQFARAAHLADQPAEVEAALWYHDVVYDPKAKDNEERSADWAKVELEAWAVSTARSDRIQVLILATKHSQEPATPDAALTVDVDLSILGREQHVFDTYDDAIRQEYAWVPKEQYRAARAAILEGFLQRPSLYATKYFRDRFEELARANLARCIERLRG